MLKKKNDDDDYYQEVKVMGGSGSENIQNGKLNLFVAMVGMSGAKGGAKTWPIIMYKMMKDQEGVCMYICWIIDSEELPFNLVKDPLFHKTI